MRVAIVDLPHGLEVLANSLPHGHPATVDGLIDGCSQLPYYGPFLPTSSYNEVRKFMKRSEDRSVRVRCGLATSRVRPPSYFRTCPTCDAENRATDGETYWNRLFQLSGVEICIKHNVFLEASGLRMNPLANRHQFVSAESSVLKSVPTPIDPNDVSHRILLGLAKDVAWLLQQERLNPGLEVIHRRYLEILHARGFATTKGGSVRMTDLRREMESYFTPKLLEFLQSTIPDTAVAGWLGRMLHKPATASVPLRHLLLMRFLEVTPQAILNPALSPAPNSTRHPDPSAWWCFNPVCAQFRKPAIKKFTLERIRKRKADAALLTCPICHYTYGLYNWSKTAANPDFVRDYGPLWLDRLKTTWLDTSVSVKHIARMLGVDSKTVKSHALSLGLPFPRQGKRRVTACGIYQRKQLQPKFTREAQRQTWLRLRRSHADLGAKELRTIAPGLYAWLYRHDRHWLVEHLPPRKTPKTIRPRVDWAKRDEELAGQIATAAAHIKNRQGKPKCVTVTAIGKVLGKQSLFEAALTKLPLTRSVINSVLESGEDFAVRRVHTAAAKLRATEGLFPRWKLVRAAGLHCRLERQPRIQVALNYEIRPFANVLVLGNGESQSAKYVPRIDWPDDSQPASTLGSGSEIHPTL